MLIHCGGARKVPHQQIRMSLQEALSTVKNEPAIEHSFTLLKALMSTTMWLQRKYDTLVTTFELIKMKMVNWGILDRTFTTYL